MEQQAFDFNIKSLTMAVAVCHFRKSLDHYQRDIANSKFGRKVAKLRRKGFID
jgi:hypothetical protein